MGVLNSDLAKQLHAPTPLGTRLWRLRPGKASTRHRHQQTTELYALLAGTRRLRVGEALHTLEPLSSVLVDAEEVRQLFNSDPPDDRRPPLHLAKEQRRAPTHPLRGNFTRVAVLGRRRRPSTGESWVSLRR